MGNKRLARSITRRSDEIIVAAMKGHPNAADAADHHARRIRLDAQLAYLDGRTARARLLNGEADRVLRAVREVV